MSRLSHFLLLLLVLSFSNLLGAEEFLDPAVAFRAEGRAIDSRTVEVRFSIAPGYYLYRDKFRFSAGDTVLGLPELPKGIDKNDETFGKVEVFYQQLVLQLALPEQAAAATPFRLKVTSQGCADAGLCYPPHSQSLLIALPVTSQSPSKTAALVTPAISTPSLLAPGAPVNPRQTATVISRNQDESGSIASKLSQAGFWANLGFFFLAGLGLAFTPCVLPMVPIVSGIIAGQGARISRTRGLLLALAYVLGMALTYAIAGVAAGLSGTLISGLLQNAWVLGGFALIFVALAGAMFGFYELQLPSALQSKIAEDAGHLRGGRGIAVFLMGALSALIIGPCVAAPLAGALLYISKTGDAWLGGSALFALALGMGTPLLLVGASAGALLPHAGAWMDGVKKAFGVLLLATALWLIAPVLPALLVMSAWASLLIVPAIFLHALDPLPAHAGTWQRLWKGIGVLMLITGAALLIGALSGSRDPLQPLAGLRVSALAAEKPLPFVTVASASDLDAAIGKAGKPVLLDFYADWCVSCKEMERDTFNDPRVRQRLQEFSLLRADVTAGSDADRALMQRFGIFGPPGIVFFAANGNELTEHRIVGYQDAERFLASLPRI